MVNAYMILSPINITFSQDMDAFFSLFSIEILFLMWKMMYFVFSMRVIAFLLNLGKFETTKE